MADLDPWDWDPDRVIQELCSTDRSWDSSSAPLRLPIDKLGSLLREHEVDGEVLLTYDPAELCADLGITILKHKSTLRNAIQTIRLLSRQYRLHQKRLTSDAVDDENDVQETIATSAQSQEDRQTQEREALNGADKGTSESPYHTLETCKTLPAPPDRKKRRVVPTTISVEVASPAYQSTENKDEDTSESFNSVVAYLGNQSVTRFDIIERLEDGGHLSEEEQEINIAPNHQPFPGRTLQAHHLMKRYFLRGSGHESVRLSKPDTVPGSNNPENNEVLPLYGESEEEDEYDSETWKEIEAEGDEEANSTRTRGLTTQQAADTFEKIVANLISAWKEKKLPHLEHRANRIWKDAHRSSSNRVKLIRSAQSNVQHLEERISALKVDFQKRASDYRNEADMESSAGNLEASVFNREHGSWILGLLFSPHEPPKVPSAPRKFAVRDRVPRPPNDDEEETLTSESEFEMDNFVVDDAGDSALPMNGGSPMHLDEDDVSQDRTSPRRASPALTNGFLANSAAPSDPTTPKKSTEQNFIDLTVTPSSKTSSASQAGSGVLPRPQKHAQGFRHTAEQPSLLIMTVGDLDPPDKLVALILQKLDKMYLSTVFTLALDWQEDEIWDYLVLWALDLNDSPGSLNKADDKDRTIARQLLRLYESRLDNKVHRPGEYKRLDEDDIERLRDLRTEENGACWNDFCNLLSRLSDRFEWNRALAYKCKRTRAPSALGENRAPSAPGESDGNQSSSSKKQNRKNRARSNREAAKLRQTEHTLMAEQERRRLLLRANIAQGNVDASGQARYIINESKRDDQGFVYVHPEIAGRIKEHQVTGVRFMWDQIVDAKTRQGCLLAHTMGLGKTMQVITLLVAIADASASADPAVAAQIPQELRQSKTLVLCPPALVDNWLDEMLSWTPEAHLLGDINKVDSNFSVPERAQRIQSWDKNGGVLIMGYNLFKNVLDVHGNALQQGPNIVVADEAHMFKNPSSKVHMATAEFRTRSRIALTGSPLANNVEEYYSMINWIAHNYLSDLREFRRRYANPIKEGLGVDSSDYARRKALRMLRVLKSEVSPKVSRITISVLKQDIPVKKEFVITVPLTDLQRQLYELYINMQPGDQQTARVFAHTDTLNLICAHPYVFWEKLKDFKKGRKDDGESVTLSESIVSAELKVLQNVNKADELLQSWKIPLLFSILDECKLRGDSVLLFSHSLIALNYLEKVLRQKGYSYDRLDGGTPIGNRQHMVKNFNSTSIDIFLISTTAGGLGLNITGANRVVIFDSKFNPQHEQQAVGRAYRIGQKKAVFVYRFVCGGTFEDQLLSNAVWKMQLAQRVVDSKRPIPKAAKFTAMFALPTEPRQEDISKHRGKDSVLDKVLDVHSRGIRAITIWDTFEEEALEEAELSAQDRAEADQMIKDNEARRSGRRPTNIVKIQVPAGAARAPAPAPASAATPFSATTPAPPSAPSAPSTPRAAAEHMADFQLFKAEISASFAIHATHVLEEGARRSWGAMLAGAVWAQTKKLRSDDAIDRRKMIKRAAKQTRFVEAICLNMALPANIAQKSTADLNKTLREWTTMDESAWEDRKKQLAQSSPGDPIYKMLFAECRQQLTSLTAATVSTTSRPCRLWRHVGSPKESRARAKPSTLRQITVSCLPLAKR
ncbi:P-loop containing nucleoside triphosphate hydrolase protein [Xylariaceae sp. FL0804]|nr:P-loop containing nucleoside triphosphate hydrolase protein [Xylariaceae sp. FL0804]